MLRMISIAAAFVLAGSALAQAPSTFRLPAVRGASENQVKPPTDDPIMMYRDRREAALAAFQAGYRGATADHNPTRAMSMFLISLRRDPTLSKALYDMGVLCARQERWDDALSFYQEVRKQPDADPAVVKLADADAARVRLIAELESSPEGKSRRKFDAQLLPLLKAPGTPAALLAEAQKLIKLDASRWEPPALAGVLQASMGAFADSARSLGAAASLAPAAKRTQLQSAAEVARREASFLDAVKGADALWDKRDYEAAAKQYANAWENSPGRVTVAMQAATGFLMADDVSLAVQMLTRLRDAATPAMAPKIVAMLKELGAVSEDARREAAAIPAPSGDSQSADAADRIRAFVGPLSSPDMELSVSAGPEFVDDKTFVVVGPDDHELTSGQNSDIMLLSTQSVFGLYRKNLAGATGAPPAAGDAGSRIPDVPALAPPVSAPPAPPANAPPPAPPPLARPAPLSNRAAEPARAASGVVEPARGSQQASISSKPPGAAVVVDADNSLNCTTPCEIALPVGRHALRATLAGHRDALYTFNVDKGKKTPVEFTLPAKEGSVAVESQSAGAIVFVNGRKTDLRTPAALTLPEGDYEIGIEVDGQMRTQKISVADGSIMKVTF